MKNIKFSEREILFGKLIYVLYEGKIREAAMDLRENIEYNIGRNRLTMLKRQKLEKDLSLLENLDFSGRTSSLMSYIRESCSLSY